MVSDQCQALERDNVFGESESRKKMVLRQPAENEMIPSVVKEGKTVKEFEPDFFLVSLAHGQPKKNKDYNIMKHYDFPALNREKGPTRKDLQDYIKRHKKDPASRRFSNFHLLLYLAEALDPDTALTVARQVGQE